VPEAVVELPPFGVREHFVGLDDLAEALLGIRRVGDVGMELAGEAPERALDVVCACITRDAEKLVVVARGAQLSS
jgi:putative NADH-flavin reductase